ncbi:hypothetical protein H8L32_18625 [Undibacterium sp. CY18W]|uniref:Uncharacterized protein n=1 Tax=Undibacterium hunanense TaxID=2762292 RepID=A0ABR6ZV73_9BURK|nr:hypothetical protein [Undibacterium hunanense]MBC3919508.1 hypothetical protein [Undibacterium hunanense]
MRLLINIFLVLGLFSYSAIATADLSDSSLASKEEQKFAKEYLQRIHNKDFAFVKSKMDAELQAKVTDETLSQLASFFPHGKVLSTELIGAQIDVVDSDWFGNFKFEYHYEAGWAVGHIALKRKNDQLTVVGFSINKTKTSQKEINRFTFSGKSAIHYVTLIAAVCVFLFILITLVVCMRTTMLKRKWLWALFIVLGVSAIDVNWTTGEYAFQLIRFQLFGAAMVANSEYSPWIITASFPLGAIVFWFRRSRLVAFTNSSKQDV